MVSIPHTMLFFLELGQYTMVRSLVARVVHTNFTPCLFTAII
jgi:hypothetical protein